MTEEKKTRSLDRRSGAGRVRGDILPHSTERCRAAAPVALKAEVVFAILVIVRHRTPRMALFFAVALVALISWQEAVGGAGVSHHRTAWMLVMVLAAVWCSRTLALGGSREAARTVAAGWWIVPTGRLVGAMTLLVPVIVAFTVLIVSGRRGAPPAISFVLTSALLGASAGAVTMALTIAMGASAAASVMFLAAVLGGIDPVSLKALLGRGWALEVVPRVWAVLPLQWRADGWPEGAGVFVLIAIAWAVAGLAAVGVAVAGPAGCNTCDD